MEVSTSRYTIVNSLITPACAGFKNYLGNTKIAKQNLYVYPDAPRDPPPPLMEQIWPKPAMREAWNNGYRDFFTEPYCANSDGQALNDSGWGDVWAENRCIMLQSGDIYNFGNCNAANPRPGTVRLKLSLPV
jgi:hypothetical protein